MFNIREGYSKPIVKELSPHVTIGIYYPLSKEKDSIITIKNLKSNESISLFSRTLINVSNSFILEVLSSTDKFFFNKRITKKEKKKGNKKKST